MKDKKFDFKVFRYELILVAPALFIFLLYIPIEIMCSNLNEYSCSLLDMIITGAGLFFITLLMLSLMATALNEKDRVIFNLLMAGLTVCIYVQYMFFNGYIGTLNGYSYKFTDNLIVSILNLILWLLLIGGLLVTGLKIKIVAEKIIYATSVIGILVFVALCTLVFTNIDELSTRRFRTFDYTERYTLGSEENVILFCFDSVDNRYFEELLIENYDFSDFSDFTLYTNTCSVFDNTQYSMQQMITASDIKTNENYSEFYTRIKENGFNIRFYSYEAGPYNYVPVHKYIDNYLEIDETDLSVDYYRLSANLFKLSGYISSPYALKTVFDVTDFEFLSQVRTENVELGNQGIYPDNDVYLAGLHLQKTSDYKKSFVYEHVKGTHGGVDSVNVTKDCLNIAAEYISQLKELGLYDDATIIFVSDHGRSDDIHIEDYPDASTPMFLIKGKRENHDRMQLSDAPVYHVDILSTILVNVGLFNSETDYELLGPSIYDFSSGDMRERAWYNEDPDRNDFFYEYKYTGTTKDLIEAVENGPDRIVSFE